MHAHTHTHARTHTHTHTLITAAVTSPVSSPSHSVLLTTEGIDTDAVDDDGWTPLHAAVYWGNMDAAELLVEKGANVNASTLNVSANSLCV